jgi:hypothetical protein
MCYTIQHQVQGFTLRMARQRLRLRWHVRWQLQLAEKRPQALGLAGLGQPHWNTASGQPHWITASGLLPSSGSSSSSSSSGSSSSSSSSSSRAGRQREHAGVAGGPGGHGRPRLGGPRAPNTYSCHVPAAMFQHVPARFQQVPAMSYDVTCIPHVLAMFQHVPARFQQVPAMSYDVYISIAPQASPTAKSGKLATEEPIAPHCNILFSQTPNSVS